jgi:hypothetical protein
MTLFEFKLLSDEDQLNLLYKEGVYIGKRKEDGKTILLYQLDSFYVEVFYRKYRYFVSEIKCTDSTSCLEPYLEQINVELPVSK